VLRATVNMPNASPTDITVIVNHLRSLSSVDDPTDGNRVRTKRRAQAEYLANLIQARQAADPNERLISVGDYNAFDVNDGYVDVIGTIKGTPAPADQVVLASSDLVNPDLTDLVDTLPTDQRYSFTFDGNAQVLDHVIVNPNAQAILSRFAYAREDADQPLVDYADGTVPDRISDHDQPVAYFSTNAAQPAGSVIISEFRLRGPAGEDDEYVELYNNTDADVTVTTTDGSAGWAVAGTDGAVRFVVPAGTVIPARRHFLGAGLGYSLCADPVFGPCYASPDQVLLADGSPASNYEAEIPDGTGLALFSTANPANFNDATRLDAAGYAAAPALYKEGAGLTPGAEVGNDLEYAWVRKQCAFVGGVGCTTPGTPKDTNDNATDFVSVDTEGQVQSLGAPGPESSFSPFQRNNSFGFTLLDPSVSASAAPNRERDFTSDPNNNATFGTLSIRRTVTNHTGGTISYIAFRIVEITTHPTPGAGVADLRALDSDSITVTLADGVTQVPVSGTFVEMPPNQPHGGALNSSMAVGYISLDGNTIADGESFNVQFLLGVQKTGTFRFYVNIEAFDESEFTMPSAPGISWSKAKSKLSRPTSTTSTGRTKGSRASRVRRR
jgi:hypothetical protein